MDYGLSLILCSHQFCMLDRTLPMKRASTSFSVRGPWSCFRSCQSWRIRSKKYLVGMRYLSCQVQLKKEVWRQCRNQLKEGSSPLFCSISHTITNLWQKSCAGRMTFTFLPSSSRTWFISRIWVTKELATCQVVLRLRKSVTQLQTLVRRECWIGQSSWVKFFFWMVLQQGTLSSVSMSKSLIFLSSCFSRSSVLLNSWQQLSN